MKRERSKQPLCSVQVRALVAFSALIAATLSIAQEPAAPASDSTEAATVSNPVDEAAASSTTETAQPRAEEAPIDMTNRVSPLEYEPTESISEDNSVSFPTDI